MQHRLHRPHSAARLSGQAGASLVETGLVLLFVCLVLGLGVYSIRHMLQQGRETRTLARLMQAKDCLVKRAAVNNRYPDYVPGELDCNNLAHDVNACFCMGNGPAKDAWDTPLCYIEGLAAPDRGLAGGAITGKNALTPASEVSRAIDCDGATVHDVAFVLVSLGSNRTPDHAGYAMDTPARLQPKQPPDCSAAENDDMFLIVTTQELRQAVTQ